MSGATPLLERFRALALRKYARLMPKSTLRIHTVSVLASCTLKVLNTDPSQNLQSYDCSGHFRHVVQALGSRS